MIAALALESGRYPPTSTFNDPGYFEEYGKRIYNDSGERFGRTDLTDALTHSINSVFAGLGSALCNGRARCPALTGALQKLGFYSIPPLDYPTEQLAASGTVRSGTSRLALAERAHRPGAAPRSARPTSWPRRCRWRWSPARSRTAAS